MIVNEAVTAVIVIIAGYLIGSFPSAYVVTRLMTGKDIRKLGSGNVGAHNTYREVGMKAAVWVAILDLGKGAAVVVLAQWLLEAPWHEPNLYVLLTTVAAIAGHMWSVYLKFMSGGNGLGPTVGALSLLLPWPLLISIGLIIVISLITRNLVLSTNISLLAMPISTWFFEHDWLYVGFLLVLIVLLVINFIPTAKAAIVKAGNRKKLTNELLRRDKE